MFTGQEVLARGARIVEHVDEVLAGDRGVEEERLVAAIGRLVPTATRLPKVS